MKKRIATILSYVVGISVCVYGGLYSGHSYALSSQRILNTLRICISDPLFFIRKRTRT